MKSVLGRVGRNLIAAPAVPMSAGILVWWRGTSDWDVAHGSGGQVFWCLVNPAPIPEQRVEHLACGPTPRQWRDAGERYPAFCRRNPIDERSWAALARTPSRTSVGRLPPSTGWPRRGHRDHVAACARMSGAAARGPTHTGNRDLPRGGVPPPAHRAREPRSQPARRPLPWTGTPCTGRPDCRTFG